MLRFDIPPVCSNAYRFQALTTFIISALYLWTPYGWASALLVVGGFIRGFISPHKCLSYKLFSKITKSAGWTKNVNAGSKMFADKIACIAGSVMFGTWLFGNPIGDIPASVLLFFSFIDLTLGFCAACWAYTLWYKVKGA